MKKKLIMILLTCSFLVIAGVCYSCSYGKRDAANNLVVDLNNEQALKDEEQMAKTQASSEQLIEDSSDKVNTSYESDIYIHVCGAVANPGVYKADSKSRIVDLIELAGGLTEDAAGDYINQAKSVTDGQRVYIPTKEEVKDLNIMSEINVDTENESETKDNGTREGSALININEANEKDLMSLPGIGQAKSKSIIEYRNANGKFKAIEDLMNIPGIKEGVFNQISSYITVK